jgi:hypothetical protein
LPSPHSYETTNNSLGEACGDTNSRICVNDDFIGVHTHPQHLATASLVTIAFGDETTSRVTRPDQGASDSTSGELATCHLAYDNLGRANCERTRVALVLASGVDCRTNLRGVSELPRAAAISSSLNKRAPVFRDDSEKLILQEGRASDQVKHIGVHCYAVGFVTELAKRQVWPPPHHELHLNVAMFPWV